MTTENSNCPILFILLCLDGVRHRNKKNGSLCLHWRFTPATVCVCERTYEVSCSHLTDTSLSRMQVLARCGTPTNNALCVRVFCGCIWVHVWAKGCGALTMESPGLLNTWNDLEPQRSPFPWLQGRWGCLYVCACSVWGEEQLGFAISLCATQLFQKFCNTDSQGQNISKESIVNNLSEILWPLNLWKKFSTKVDILNIL